MKKSLIILFLIALIPFTDISAKRVRYFFNKVEISNGPDDIRRGQGTYIVELNTDNQTVVVKFKPNGTAKWDSIKRNIKNSGMYSESPDSETKWYKTADGTAILSITFNTIHSYTVNVSFNYYSVKKGKPEYMSFGKPIKVEKF